MHAFNGRCTLPGCMRPTQKSDGSGYSPRYCKHHVEFHRRHGSYWFKSFAASELAPFRAAARSWLKENKTDYRVGKAIQAIRVMLETAGRAETAYSIRGLPAEKRARVALARLREAHVDPKVLLERAIAVIVCCDSRGIDDRQREYRFVQIAKSIHRLASGTHRTPSGFYVPPKYPRSEGRVLRYLGQWFDDLAAFALDNREIGQEPSHK